MDHRDLPVPACSFLQDDTGGALESTSRLNATLCFVVGTTRFNVVSNFFQNMHNILDRAHGMFVVKHIMKYKFALSRIAH